MEKNLDKVLSEFDEMVFFPGKENTTPKSSYKGKTEYKTPEQIKEELPYFCKCWDGY